MQFPPGMCRGISSPGGDARVQLLLVVNSRAAVLLKLLLSAHGFILFTSNTKNKILPLKRCFFHR
jgi:hypothetical protein